MGYTAAIKCPRSAGRQKGKVERALGLKGDANGSEPELFLLEAGDVTLGKSFCLIIIPTM